MLSLIVRDPGLQSTVQDYGRPSLGHLGVPAAGAMDTRSMAIANLLVGNDPAAAVLEMTIAGPRLEVTESAVIGLAGADLGGILSPSGARVLPGRSYRLDPGSTLSFPGRGSSGQPDGPSGSRGYVALPGGIDAPVVLGSRSTCLAGHFGGLDGRPLRAADELHARDAGRLPSPVIWPVEDARPRGAAPAIRVVRGPIGGADAGLRRALDELLERTWTVRPDSDRMGVRLDGPSIATGGAGELLSLGVPWGSIQVPPSGLPIVLAADHQSTGGYPVVAVVATVDRPVIGQLTPGDQVRFELVDLGAARRAFLDEEGRFRRLAAQLEEARTMADAIGWAGS